VAGESRRGGGQLSGRDPYHRVVNFAAPPEAPPQLGDLVTVRVVEASPHSLIGEIGVDESVVGVRRSLKGSPAQADERGRISVLDG
jgi:hypothetical protein